MHHYAAALNSIPFFDHALRSPSDPWLWRLAQCAGGGTLSNIRPDGSASMGLHADPDLLHLDGFSADFGTRRASNHAPPVSATRVLSATPPLRAVGALRSACGCGRARPDGTHPRGAQMAPLHPPCNHAAGAQAAPPRAQAWAAT